MLVPPNLGSLQLGEYEGEDIVWYHSGYFWFDNTMFGSCSHGMDVLRNILSCSVGTYGCGSVCVESC
jgi:hypothetical protein